MDKKLLTNARNLRKSMTKQERHLWYDFLRSYPIKIYKQKIIEQYIVDFCCSSANLIIELDGGQHYDPSAKQYDATRTKWLEQYGFTVLRIPNDEIDTNFNNICSYIDKMIKERIES